MEVRDWFEGIRAKVLDLAEKERHIEELRGQTEPHGQQFGTMGHGGTASDASAPIIRLAQAEDELDRESIGVNAEVEDATEVLYGADGRGGLAYARGSVDADILCAYYLQGMSWEQVARSLSGKGGRNVKQWCIMRAQRSLCYIERHGTDYFRTL